MVSGKRFKGGDRTMSKADITSWDENILQVSVPMDSPLRQVNSYILPDEDGRITIIDPGPRSPETEKCWQAILQELGLSWKDVRDIVVTHHHPDHYGLAGWLQLQTGCKVWMTERAHAEAMLMWGSDTDINEVLPLYFIRHGMSEEWSSGIKAHLESFDAQVEPQPVVTYLNEVEPFRMGGREWQLIVTGGHAPGHVSLYHAGSGQMICGDAVLPQISPNVSLLPGSDPQPLQTFLQGLRELGSYPVSMAFPGHREPFTGFAHRVSSLLAHHEERLDAAAALLANGPLSGFAVCEILFRSRVTTVHQMRFAMSETLAHLAELMRRERAVMIEADGAILFAASESAGDHVS
ncbi:MBL fold metallo-hydrolase [Paenibacillus sp. FSL H7-0716]